MVTPEPRRNRENSQKAERNAEDGKSKMCSVDGVGNSMAHWGAKHTLELLECRSGVGEPCMEQKTRGQGKEWYFPSSLWARKGRAVGFELWLYGVSSDKCQKLAEPLLPHLRDRSGPLQCLPQCCCEVEIEVRLWRDKEMQRH